MDTEKKRSMEIDVMMEMIDLYCRGQGHANRTDLQDDTPALCPDCRRLLDYARKRIIRCPRMAVKSFCSACPVHCYTTDMREQIRVVMRYSGPRMLLHRPLMTLQHIWIDLAARRREKKLAKRSQHNQNKGYLS